MAQKILVEIAEKKEFKLKKFFYALRTASICRWIIEMEEIPPIEFQKVFSNLGLDSKTVDRIEELIELKSTKSESYIHTGEHDLISFIKSCLALAEEKKNTLPAGNCKMNQLNQVLRKYVNKYDH